MGMQVMQAQQQAKAAQQQADYEAAVQRNNNIMSQRAQQDAIRRGKREETLRRLQTAQDVSTKRGRLAGGGFSVNTGSALTAQSDIRAMGNVEALTIRSNAQREAYGMQVDNAKERAGSAGRVAQYKNKAKSSLISGATSALGTGLSAYQNGAFKF
jgi:hypothetical protein